MIQTIEIELDSAIANKFDVYIQLFGSENLLFDEFIAYHIGRLKKSIARMQLDIERYEKKYNIKTVDFYKQFEAGALGDENDFILWAGIYELQIDAQDKLSKLL
jgi:hypothetical protein